MERSAMDDDVKTCPSCGRRDDLKIVWIPEIDSRIHERTDVGCAKCGKWISAKKDRWAIAEWNYNALSEWRRRGIEDEYSTLHDLLFSHSKAEQEISRIQSEIDKYLEQKVAPQCPFVSGELFTDLEAPGSVWSVRNVRAVYGTNTGPFWIIDAQIITHNGRLGNERKEFWQSNSANLKGIEPFWKPTHWYQVVPGDECRLEGQPGSIISVDRFPHAAYISIGDKKLKVKNLSKLMVPISRMKV